ncbi:MAG: outer membrane beta-barrel protein [Desulfovibrionaceae bacterium]
MKRIVAVVALGLLALGLLAPGAEAGRRYLFTPKIKAGAEYNDDVQYLGDGDMVFTVTPELQLEIDSERTEHTITASLTRYKYADLDSFDRTETGVSLESVHRATERLTLRGNVGYEVDYTLTSAEDEYGTTAEMAERGVFSLGARAEYMATELLLLGLSYNYSSTQYDSKYVDVAGHSLGLDAAWRITERTTLLGAVSEGWYASEFLDSGEGDYRVTSFTAGIRHRLTEIWTVFGTGGVRLSENDLDTGGTDDVFYDEGWILNAGVEWQFERSRGELVYSHDNTAGLSGSRLDRDRIRISHTYRTTERSALTANAGVTQSKSDGVLTDSKYRGWSAGLAWRYDTTEDSRLWIGYQHQASENLLSHDENDRNRYYIRFEVGFPEEWTLGGARW